MVDLRINEKIKVAKTRIHNKKKKNGCFSYLQLFAYTTRIHTHGRTLHAQICTMHKYSR